MSNLLVVDDEPSICWGLKRLGEQLGHRVTTVASAEEALAALESFPPDVVVLDVRLPGMSGLEALDHLRKRAAGAPVLVITAYGDLETAAQAMRGGAFEYLIKPFDLQQVRQVLTRALAACQSASRPGDSSLPASGPMVGRAPLMQEAFKRIALAATSEACVLLTGESGTGKELAARAIHQYSARADGPFVAVNVAALSGSLAESELFGHVRGAFTGAEDERQGLLPQAHQGTLFLDEVADIPPPVQVKLLRALEHGEVTPVGSNRPVQANFRVIAATHQNLLESVRAGRFRHDLYFRLCTFQVMLPALRERPEDIVLLAEHFANRSAGGAVQFSEELCSELRRRTWQGNVRELRNAMEHALIVARGGVLLSEHLPPPIESGLVQSAGGDGDMERELQRLVQRWAEQQLGLAPESATLHDDLLGIVEPPLFRAALEAHGGQVAVAARRLGCHRTTLRRKLDHLDEA